MKKKTKPIVRTRVVFISIRLRNMKYWPHLNGLGASFHREVVGTGMECVNNYHHVTDASLLRIARVGHDIGARDMQHD